MGFLSVSELCGVYLSQSLTILDRMADLAQKKKKCVVSYDILFERKYHMLLLWKVDSKTIVTLLNKSTKLSSTCN